MQPLPSQTLALDPLRLQRSTYRRFYSQPVRWSDTQEGILSHLGVAQLYEDTRAMLIRDIVGDKRFTIGQWKAVARAITIEHLAPARYGQPLELAASISHIGRTSYSFALAVFQAERCVSLGRSVSVTVGNEIRPAVIPDTVRDLLQSSLWFHDGPDAVTVENNTLVRSQDEWPFSLDYQSRFSDTDAVGHINNVALIRYYENGLRAFNLALAGDVAARGTDGYWHAAHQDISMRGESFYPTAMRVCIAVVGDVAPTHFTLRQALYQDDRCTGWTHTCVCVLDALGEPRPISPGLRAKLEAFRIDRSISR